MTHWMFFNPFPPPAKAPDEVETLKVLPPEKVEPPPVVRKGCECAKCEEFYFFAEPNQPDGTMICWSCRSYPFYK
jgi:formylmethanofuran dehydrogenase subunit E